MYFIINRKLEVKSQDPPPPQMEVHLKLHSQSLIKENNKSKNLEEYSFLYLAHYLNFFHHLLDLQFVLYSCVLALQCMYWMYHHIPPYTCVQRHHQRCNCTTEDHLILVPSQLSQFCQKQNLKNLMIFFTFPTFKFFNNFYLKRNPENV